MFLIDGFNTNWSPKSFSCSMRRSSNVNAFKRPCSISIAVVQNSFVWKLRLLDSPPVHPGLQNCLRILLLRSTHCVKKFVTRPLSEFQQVVSTVASKSGDTQRNISVTTASVVIKRTFPMQSSLRLSPQYSIQIFRLKLFVSVRICVSFKTLYSRSSTNFLINWKCSGSDKLE